MHPALEVISQVIPKALRPHVLMAFDRANAILRRDEEEHTRALKKIGLLEAALYGKTPQAIDAEDCLEEPEQPRQNKHSRRYAGMGKRSPKVPEKNEKERA